MRFFVAKGSTTAVILLIIATGFLLFFFAGNLLNPSKKPGEYYPGASSTDRTTITSNSAKSSADTKGVNVGIINSGNSAGVLVGGSVSTPSTIQIIYTNSGFAPNSVVLSGQRPIVTFINRSKNLLWPIAAGETNPPLDSTFGLQPGESYTYTFSTGSAGSDSQQIYGYYNRLDSKYRGIIKVQ